MKPKEKFRTRPKKTGARKKQRILTHKKRLVAAGYERAKLDKMTPVDLRNLLKKVAKRKAVKK
ncbi:MAG: hypothetical protein PHW46_02045 [Candidatus Omnitrophica bacterium]|nr:hypothetical protein [Candidatus Omnitrophota bacterium]